MSKKKQDPEALHAQFEAWKASEQYKFWLDIHQLQQDKLKRISQTSKDLDLNGKFQLLWDAYYKFALFLKIKPPLKQLRHQWIRSIYFGELVKDDPQKGEKPQPAKYDGVVIDLPKDIHDSQNGLRQTLIKGIYNTFAQLDPVVLNQTTYQKIRSDLKKAFVELFKRMKNHLKKPYKFVYEQVLMTALKPIKSFLQVNARMYLFELNCRTSQDQFVYEFKRKAYIKKFCEHLQQLLRILKEYQSKKLKYTPDLTKIFYKLDYNWAENPIEKFYLQKLNDSLDQLKRNSMCLFSTGINFWISPLENNQQLTRDIITLVNWEVICDRILGNPLIRAQFNFIFLAVKQIHNSHQLAAKNLKNFTSNSVQKALPELLAFKSAQRIRQLLDKKAFQSAKQKKLPSISQRRDQGPGQALNRSSISQLNQRSQSLIQEENIKHQLDIWEGMLDLEHRKIIEDCAQRLRHINKAVQIDIEDYIIKQAMISNLNKSHPETKESASLLDQIRISNNADIVSKITRPPQLWNFPKVVQEQHKFRAIVQPKRCYIDGRFEQLQRLIKQVGLCFRTFNRLEWNQLATRSVEFFKNELNQVVRD